MARSTELLIVIGEEMRSMPIFGFTGFSLFLILCFAHCLCDFPLQSDKMAVGKSPGSAVEGMAWPYWLAGHAGTHALALLDGAIDHVLGHIGQAGGDHGRAQAGVMRRVG